MTAAFERGPDATPESRSVEEITARDLARALESAEPIQILDVRAPAALRSGVIDLAAPGRFYNRPGSQILSGRAGDGGFVTRELPVAVVCQHGNDSRVVADYLKRQGYRAVSVAGGMGAWMGVVIPRELPAPSGFDRLIQFDRPGKGSLGYAVMSDGEALLVDPPRDPSACLALVERAGARIAGVADTHVHADYVSGAPALANSLGVPYFLHAADAVSPYDGRAARIEYAALADGETLPVGRGVVRAQHTPGHTEGSVTYRLGDEAALTGDFVFIGSVGRPDLGGRTAEWTPILWASLERARREWPDGLRIYPAHYASAEEREPDRTVGRRFADLLRGNEALRIQRAEDFATWVTARADEVPEAYRIMKELNLGLITATPAEIGEIEGGRNRCALG
jgi:glyoxylase-like metal-dependent hydrolase (beta-lactamase superfamily II)